MNRQLLAAEFLSTPWAMMPERLNAFAAVMSRWSAGIRPSEESMEKIKTDRQLRTERKASLSTSIGSGIAVLSLYGVVTQRGNMVDDVSGPGSTSTQKFSTALRQVLADESVSQILIDIDSPGGSVYGVSELADEIYRAQSKKPVIALANSLAASAAYWVGSAATEFYVTPGGEVGSIGVWQSHFDYSEALAFEGVKPTLISSGKYKVEGNPYAPLDAEALGFMQSRVDEYYTNFIKAVAKGRGVTLSEVRDGMGQGRVLGADTALEQRMVDGVITFDDLLRKMQRSFKVNSSTHNRVEHARRSIALAEL